MAISLWDTFVDFCHDNGLDPAVEDFDAWSDERAETLAEYRADLDRKYAQEN